MKARVKELRRYGVQLVTLISVVAAFAVVAPGMTFGSSVYSLLEASIPLGIVAAGLAITMVAGELDLSVASMAALAGVIAVQLGDIGILGSIVLATLAGVLLGALQGHLISRLAISSLVFTVGSLVLLQGVAWLAAGGKPVTLNDLEQTDALLRRVGALSTASIIGVLTMIGVGVFLARAKWGREIYAIGGARTEATAAGVPVGRSLTLTFAISGGCAALGGAVAALQGGSADPSGFKSLLLAAAAACLIGGVSLYGGHGNMINVAFGVAIIAVLTTMMSAIGAPSYRADLITGILLLLVIGLEFGIGRFIAARGRIGPGPSRQSVVTI